jgi:hypothetical protein
MNSRQSNQGARDLDEKAMLALEAARRMRPGPEKTEALKKTGLCAMRRDRQAADD